MKGERKFLKFPSIRKRLGMGFLLLLFLSACQNKPKEILSENEYYACSMDPQVLEKQAGPCPICKMPLAKVVIDKSQMDIVKLNAAQIKLGNVKVEDVKISSIGKETVLAGVFAVNQNATEQISSRINGRIEKLYHKIIGEEIKSGEPVYDLYSRDLKLAQEEFLSVLEKPELFGGESAIATSKNKLYLWGLSEKQVSELEKIKQAKITNTIYSSATGTITEIPMKEGDIVNEGTKIYQVADLSSLWVEAQMYSNELGLLEEGIKVEIVPDAFPDEAMEGVITFSNPELQNQSKINLVRVEVKNSSGKFRPGMQAYVIHHSEEKKAIVLPIDAVLQDSKMKLVWIQNKEGGFESRIVETGIENKFRIEIKSGLNVGDKVVTSGAYLINSEYIFKLGMMPMGDMKMDNRKMDAGKISDMSMPSTNSSSKMSEENTKIKKKRRMIVLKGKR